MLTCYWFQPSVPVTPFTGIIVLATLHTHRRKLCIMSWFGKARNLFARSLRALVDLTVWNFTQFTFVFAFCFCNGCSAASLLLVQPLCFIMSSRTGEREISTSKTNKLVKQQVRTHLALPNTACYGF